MADYVLTRERYYSYYPSLVVSRIVNAIVGIVEFILVLRFVLQLFGANAAAPVVAWVYSLSNALIGPFAGAFPAVSIGGFVIDFSVVFAMVGYAFIGWLVLRIIDLVFAPVEAI